MSIRTKVFSERDDDDTSRKLQILRSVHQNDLQRKVRAVRKKVRNPFSFNRSSKGCCCVTVLSIALVVIAEPFLLQPLSVSLSKNSNKNKEEEIVKLYLFLPLIGIFIAATICITCQVLGAGLDRLLDTRENRLLADAVSALERDTPTSATPLLQRFLKTEGIKRDLVTLESGKNVLARH